MAIRWTKEIWLKIGQSNSVGSNGTEPVYTSGVDAVDPKVFEMSRGVSTMGIPARDEGQLIPAYVQAQDNANLGNGFAQIFGKDRIAANPDLEQIILINAGVGGTSFSGGHWIAGQSLALIAHDLLVLAMQNFGDAVFAGILWHQGENDEGQTQAYYEAWLAHLVRYLRRGAMAVDSTRVEGVFMCGTMLESWVAGSEANRRPIDLAHRNVSNYIEKSAVVDFQDLTDARDSVHFSGDSLRTMGSRYAIASESLIDLSMPVSPTEPQETGAWIKSKNVGGGFSAFRSEDLGAKPPSTGLYYLNGSSLVRSVPIFNVNIASISPRYLKKDEAYDLLIAGENLTGASEIEWSSDSVSVTSSSILTESTASASVTVSAVGDYSASSGVYGDSEGSSSIIGVYEDILVPGDGTTSWDNQSNVTVSEGEIEKTGGGAAWDSGGSFGSVISDQDYRLIFTVGDNLTGTRKLMVGMAESYVSASWEDIEYGLYFGGSANSINAIENGTVSTSLGTYSDGDIFQIVRTGTSASVYLNDEQIHTYADTSSEANLLAKVSILSSTANLQDISLMYR